MKVLAAAALAILAAPASAEVVSATTNAFHVRHRIPLAVSADSAFAAFGQVEGWWEDAHTYSGSAANLSLAAKPGGCFCERLPTGGGVEHLRVVVANPDERQLVLTGSLGPLLYQATSGVMDVRVKSSGAASELTLDYRVVGFADGDAAKLAPLVDGVLATLLRRLRAFAVRRPARP